MSYVIFNFRNGSPAYRSVSKNKKTLKIFIVFLKNLLLISMKAARKMNFTEFKKMVKGSLKKVQFYSESFLKISNLNI